MKFKRLKKALYPHWLMSNSLKLILCFTLMIFLFTSNPLVAKTKSVTIATLFDYAPYCIADTGFQSSQTLLPDENAIGFRGYSWDVLRESFQFMGYSINLKIVPWARAVSMVKSHQADILFPTGVNKERKKIFHFSDEPINSANFKVYVNTQSKLKWQGLTSLSGLSIGVKRGFNYGDKWDAMTDINIINVTTIVQGFKMLKAKRIDGFLGYETNWDYSLKQQKWLHRFKKLPAFGSTNEFLVALKTNPNAKVLLADFDAGKRHLIKSGRLVQISEKWFGKEKD